jgi:penicillin G amidase
MSLRRVPARRAVRVLPAAVVSLVVLGVLAAGVGPVPALGQVLDPGRGVWTSAATGGTAHSEDLAIPGLQHPVSVFFTAQGVPSIRAADEHDLYLAQGYVEASYRLAQMDVDRRLGEGRLAELAGSADLSSDEFELRLGLLRTATQEWAQTGASSTTGQELTAYSAGVNDYIAHARATGAWPALFTLTGVYPRDWTPVDSLVIQEVLTQELDFTTAPLDYALLEESLGAAKTMQWFPVQPANKQTPYDPGPYQDLGLTPIAADAASSAGTDVTGPATGEPAPGNAAQGNAAQGNAAQGNAADAAEAAGALLADVNRLPAGQVHQYSDSNAWAANGPSASGGSILAGDPHLPLTLPSTWYQLALSAPGLAVSGVSLPGLPGIVIGHNEHIAWSLTDVQNQSTLFYAEQTSKSRPGEYYWRGAWRKMQQARYTINVHGGAAVHLTVDITVHGPIMTQAGQTLAVDWMGNVPSPDLGVMSQIMRASDFAQFRQALSAWKAPTQNFVYADDAGNIGAISAGYYPEVAHGDPWLPLPGTGADDIAGVIPYAAVPQVYNPPGHVVATANQRPVSASYPYYIGTSADSFDPGYRASEIYSFLRARPATTASFASLQVSVVDSLAGQMVPSLLAALRAGPALTSAEQTAMAQLTGWNDEMSAGSAGAAIWYSFWSEYLAAVFQPWWTADKVPVQKDPGNINVSIGQGSLNEDLQEWTLADPGNQAFTTPDGVHRTAPQVMRSAFAAAVRQLSAKLGGSPASWTWGKLHSTQIPALTGATALGYGPRPAGGDPFTVNAANGYPVSSQGPSWRMIVNWTGQGQAVAQDIYPGGQSENPASAWYSNLIDDWWNDRYQVMPPAGGYTAGSAQWSLRPAAYG